MEVSFTRSGGFAGLATGITASVAFSDGTATVTSGATYSHTLSAEETRRLRGAVAAAARTQAGPPIQLRDGYQYDIRITDGGQTRTLTIHDEMASGSETLMAWVREECDRIWTQRTSR